MQRTHHVPYFVIGQRLADGREQAVCGQYVSADQIAPKETLPTCWGCATWVRNLDVIDPTSDNQTRRAASDVMEAL